MEHYEHDFVEIKRNYYDVLYECQGCGLQRWNFGNEWCTCIDGPRMVNPSDGRCCSCNKKEAD